MNSNINENEHDEWDDIVIPTISPEKVTLEKEKIKNEKEILEEQKKALAAEKREKILAANAETARLNQLYKDEQKALKAAERKAKEEKEAEEIREKELARKKLEAELGTPEKIFKHDFKLANKHKYVIQKVNRSGGAPIYTGMKELDDAADKAWKRVSLQAR
jgi:hypothetical protein